MSHAVARVVVLTVGLLVPTAAFAQSTVLPAIQVIGSTPTGGDAIDRDKLPSGTTSLISDDFARTKSSSVQETLTQQTPGLSISDVQGNPFAADINFHGFTASSVQGTAQGLSVYVNGVRVNEAFGDTVNFDLVPSVAINRADVWTSNPIFGLNALGGAINLEMKDGFNFKGLETEVSGGSFGRISGSLQYGLQHDNWALYIAGEGIHDDGWRDLSPSNVKRFYGDVGYKGDRSEFHLNISGASNRLGVIGPTPVDELSLRRSSVYTSPQTTTNQMLMMGFNGKVSITDNWAVQGNVYVRHFDQRHVDGNVSQITACDPAGANAGSLCINESLISNALTGDALSTALLPATGTNAGIAGSIDRTNANSNTVGGSLQTTYDGPLLGLNNHFVFGSSLDYSTVSFNGSNELGTIADTTINPVVVGTGITYQSADGLVQPLGLTAKNLYFGLYASDTIDITDRLSATLGARLNVAQINLTDRLGTSPGLTGNHTYARLNPLAGLAFKITPEVSVYGGYSEANRAPTPLELGCANPAQPCLLEGFLVSDPELKQVVSRTFEAGFRGHSNVTSTSVIDWKLGAFLTNNSDDILSQPSPIVTGYGYYVNAGNTRRQGVDASLQYRTTNWSAYASLAYVDATYRSNLTLTSSNNPFADANGNIYITPGNHIPGISPWQFKLGGDYRVTDAWTVGGDMMAMSSQYYAGDDANQNARLPGYVVFNGHTSYKVTENIKLFAKLDNVFNEKYATYGGFAQTGSIPSLNLVNPQTNTPGAPRAIYGGINIKF